MPTPTIADVLELVLDNYHDNQHLPEGLIEQAREEVQKFRYPGIADSKLLQHAQSEYRILGWTDTDGTFNDPVQEEMCNGVNRLLQEFSRQGHSGLSAEIARNLFISLARFEPLSPLTGTDDEWGVMEVTPEYEWQQNKRSSRVLRKRPIEGGEWEAFDVSAVVFRDKDGRCYTSKDSCRKVQFPYTPHTSYLPR